MHSRTADILEAAVREYIASGLPVSSGQLYKRYEFGIKPAMIRLELESLADAGYLEQPHHASGRVPCDKAFEFYAERALENGRAHVPSKTLADLGAAREWSSLAAHVSRELNALSVLAEAVSGVVYKEGLERLVENLEWQDRKELTGVIRDFESIDERLEAFAHADQPSVQVFIGRRSPITKSGQLAALTARYSVGRGYITIVAIGPKRMDYQKGAQMFRSLFDVFN